MFEMFIYPFFQKALMVGFLIGFASSYFSAFVVQRKISFIGSGLAHAAFGGVALGLLVGIEPLWIALPFTLLVSFLIVYLQNKTKVSTDAIIGVIFSVAVALGIIFLSLKKEYSQDAYSYLFGSILTVSIADIIISFILLILTVISMKLFWSRWAYSTFDSELARSDRINVDRDDYILVFYIGLTTVLAIKIIGIILISAFLVIPGAASKLIAKTFKQMILYSIIIGVCSNIVGLILSYQLDLPSGAVIIMLQALIFVVFAMLRKRINP
jgi:zinc transport system permease protein